MKIRVGYELVYRCEQATPMILTVSVHYSRASDLVSIDHLVASPSVPVTAYRDSFGNWCSRIVAPPGRLQLSASAIVNDSGEPDAVMPDAQQHAVQDLPGEVLLFLLGSRYCETDLMTEVAWELFGSTPTGWPRVQAISNFVHQHIVFGYENACATRTARQAYEERVGVCRDFTHLAITLLRCMNIPARYCTGYLGDMGTPLPHGPMDFAAWLEVYLQGRWHVVDPRNGVPRIGRVLIARGRDAADVPISNSFGPCEMERFQVWTEEI